MIIDVFIEPDDRADAIEAYRDRLSAEQIDQIQDAPISALIRLSFNIGSTGATLQVIEEG